MAKDKEGHLLSMDLDKFDYNVHDLAKFIDEKKYLSDTFLVASISEEGRQEASEVLYTPRKKIRDDIYRYVTIKDKDNLCKDFVMKNFQRACNSSEMIHFDNGNTYPVDVYKYDTYKLELKHIN